MPRRLRNKMDWPPRVLISIYDEDMLVVDQSRDTQYDLNDNLFQTWGSHHRTVYLGIETQSKRWHVWDQKALKWIESKIVWDLEFDGNDVEVSRHTQQIGHPCAEEFIWKVEMRDD